MYGILKAITHELGFAGKWREQPTAKGKQMQKTAMYTSLLNR